MTLVHRGQMASPPALDRRVLADLRTAVGDETGEFIASIVAVYAAQAVELVAEMTVAAKDGDARRLGFLAHSLKGSSANVGGNRLADLCGDLEHWRGAPEALPARVASVETELTGLLIELNEFAPPQ